MDNYYKRSLRFGRDDKLNDRDDKLNDRDDKVCGVTLIIAETHTAYSETEERLCGGMYCHASLGVCGASQHGILRLRMLTHASLRMTE